MYSDGSDFDSSQWNGDNHQIRRVQYVWTCKNYFNQTAIRRKSCFIATESEERPLDYSSPVVWQMKLYRKKYNPKVIILQITLAEISESDIYVVCRCSLLDADGNKVKTFTESSESGSEVSFHHAWRIDPEASQVMVDPKTYLKQAEEMELDSTGEESDTNESYSDCSTDGVGEAFRWLPNGNLKIYCELLIVTKDGDVDV
jgi:hypothetical protein